MARSVIIIGDGEEEGGGEGAGATAICDALPRSAKKQIASPKCETAKADLSEETSEQKIRWQWPHLSLPVNHNAHFSHGSSLLSSSPFRRAH